MTRQCARRFRIAATLCGTLGALGLSAPDSVHAQTTSPGTLVQLSGSFEALTEQVLPGVVQVFASGQLPAGSASESGGLLRPFATIGSGAIVSEDGLILTNAHVVQNARRVEILFSGRRNTGGEGSILPPEGKRIGARIVGLDTETDLALLRVNASGLPALEFADSDELQPGQLVFAFGSPQGLTNSVSMGVVSAVARQPAPEHPMVYIQTDAAISPGSSGGPLIDAHGRIAGINTWILSRSGGSEGLAFAIPSNIAQAIFEQIRDFGRVTRGEIGVHAQTITPRLATGLELNRSWGVILGDVRPNGPADRAGIRPGDLVLALNGKPMENGRQLDVNIYRFRPGARVTLEIDRAGESMLFDVEVTQRDDDRARFEDLATRERNLLPELGILAVALDPKVRELLPQLRIRTGLLVAARAGAVATNGEALAAGDIIHRINGSDVASLEDARESLENLPLGSLVGLQVERRGELRFLVVERR